MYKIIRSGLIDDETKRPLENGEELSLHQLKFDTCRKDPKLELCDAGKCMECMAECIEEVK